MHQRFAFVVRTRKCESPSETTDENVSSGSQAAFNAARCCLRLTFSNAIREMCSRKILIQSEK